MSTYVGQCRTCTTSPCECVSTPFSNFIRFATVDEKTKVYTGVMVKVHAEMNAAIQKAFNVPEEITKPNCNCVGVVHTCKMC